MQESFIHRSGREIVPKKTKSTKLFTCSPTGGNKALHLFDLIYFIKKIRLWMGSVLFSQLRYAVSESGKLYVSTFFLVYYFDVKERRLGLAEVGSL